MTLLHTLKKAYHIDHLLHKGLTLRICSTATNYDFLTTLHERALFIAVEPLPPNLCAVAYLPRANKNPLKPASPDADDSFHSDPSPDAEKPEPIDPHINPISTDQINHLTSPSEQSLQAIRRAETTDFDHGFTKPFPSPSHTQPQPAFDPDDSVVTSDDLPPPPPAENPSDSPLPFAALCDDSTPD